VKDAKAKATGGANAEDAAADIPVRAATAGGDERDELEQGHGD